MTVYYSCITLQCIPTICRPYIALWSASILLFGTIYCFVVCPHYVQTLYCFVVCPHYVQTLYCFGVCPHYVQTLYCFVVCPHYVQTLYCFVECSYYFTIGDHILLCGVPPTTMWGPLYYFVVSP